MTLMRETGICKEVNKNGRVKGNGESRRRKACLFIVGEDLLKWLHGN